MVSPVTVMVDFVHVSRELFASRGAGWYAGESVSQLEHALQSAHLAALDGAPEPLILAALLHDVGHLLHDLPEDAANDGIDTRHESIGPEWLATFLPEPVVAPIRLHVDAKRYLCGTDAGYLETLSLASVQSLILQGGPMDADEVLLFERQPFWREALLLRGWDDQAKVPGADVPGFEHYVPLLRRHLRQEYVRR